MSELFEVQSPQLGGVGAGVRELLGRLHELLARLLCVTRERRAPILARFDARRDIFPGVGEERGQPGHRFLSCSSAPLVEGDAARVAVGMSTQLCSISFCACTHASARACESSIQLTCYDFALFSEDFFF